MRWSRAATVASLLWVVGGCSGPRSDDCELPGCAPDVVDAGRAAADAGKRDAGSAGRSDGGSADGNDAGHAGGRDSGVPEADAGVLRATFEPVGPYRASFVGVTATPTAVFLATATGIRRSRDGGESWTILEQTELAYVTAMAAAGSELFIVANQLTYRSTDDGETWQYVPLDLGQFASFPTYLSSRGSDVYLLANGEPFRWNAGAASWDRLPDEGHGLSLDVLESDGTALYGNQHSRGGVFRLDLEAGDTAWTPVEGLGQWGYSAFAFMDQDGFTANHMTVFGRGAEAGWTALETPLDHVIDLLALDGTIYAAAADGLHESVDRGASWSHTQAAPFSSAFALATDGTNVFAVSDALWHKRGPAGAWQRQALAADEVWRLASAGESLFSISASGFFRVSDPGEWETVSIPAPGDVSSIAVRDGEVFVGTSLGGVFVSADGGRSFVVRSHPGTGDGSVECVASIERGLVAAVQRIGGADLYLSTDGAETWVALPQVVGGKVLDGIVETRGVLLGSGKYSGTYRSADQGQTWNALALSDDIGELREFAMLQDEVFGVSSRGGVARSSDQGETWVRAGLDALPVSSLVVFRDLIFAGVGSAKSFAGGVYYSADLGATWALFDPRFDARVNALAVHHDRLFAGTADQSSWAASLSSVPNR